MSGTFLDCGFDVGSTTAKCVIINENNEILLKIYRRHNAHQAECVAELLKEVQNKFPTSSFRTAITGSGGRALAAALNAQFIQEVNALTLATETLIPDAGSVVELGGQDAKVILWKGDAESKTTLTYMNDKCAGGTGSTIDKILGKIGLSHSDAAKINLAGLQPHQIAAKCGVFAETDVVGLLKAGISKEEIFVSLCRAIVRQNLEVLVRGNVLCDKVILLGGPNTYISAFAPIWREEISEAWKVHGYLPLEQDLQKAIIVPEESQYFAAIGAVLFARNSGHYTEYKAKSIDEKLILKLNKMEYSSKSNENSGLVKNHKELETFKQKYCNSLFAEKNGRFSQQNHEKNNPLDVFIGIDGGSTSSKIAIIDKTGTLIYRDYVLSSGNPLDDMKIMFSRIKEQCENEKIELKILGAAATGYAQEILKSALNLDISIVETVAHLRSSQALYGDVDVICDVGGQDIKVLFMKHGRVVDFKLNTQCSAGNGYFLQAMADQFNVPIEQYADFAFRAKKAPKFNYGCAVFMEQDRVNFQQAGWTKEEMMCGLAQVLPLNIWNYVVQESNLRQLGKKFVLQGGTQKNLAAVKAQIDFITQKVENAEVFVHKYADIAGAVGAALEVKKASTASAASTGSATGGGFVSSFIGIEAASKITFKSTNNDSTRCKLCNNKCRRTFVDIQTDGRSVRFVSGYLCEKGASTASTGSATEAAFAHDPKTNSMHNPVAEPVEAPDITALAAKWCFSEFEFEPLPKDGTKINRADFYPAHSERIIDKNEWEMPFQRNQNERRIIRVGIPKLLNMFYYAPLFSTYFRTLGAEVVFSDFTSEKLWNDGNKWGAIDPCFPAKVAPAHIWQLLNKKDINAIFFPIITILDTCVKNTLGNTACVIQMGTPEVVEAVFTREKDWFKEKNMEFFDPSLNLDREVEACDKLHKCLGEKFNISRDENAWAFRQGIKAMQKYLSLQRELFTETMNKLIDENKVGLLLIGHPYHHDFGLNHKIPEEFCKRGYPVFTIESIPTDDDFLDNLFDKNDSRNIEDVWIRNFNRNTNHKIWAAKVAARHPNMGVIDLSSFKCGHDAPTYNYIDKICDVSGTPHFTFHDIDQNRPGATFKIRIETIDYFLKEYERSL